MTSNCAIVGGGVMGLSIAYLLSEQEHQVVVIDRRMPGRQASWAGAGILSPANADRATHPIEQLRAHSNLLHQQWANQLLEETGIDNGYRKCGAVYMASSQGESWALAMLRSQWQQDGVNFQELDAGEVPRRFPALQYSGDPASAALLVPDECQLRNPSHLKALRAACQARGVRFLTPVHPLRLLQRAGRLDSISSGSETIHATIFCFTAGAWTGELLGQLGIHISIVPIRGQMLLFKLPEKLSAPVVNVGSRYIVPRDDGHVLVGSTLEDVGFDFAITESARADLLDFAKQTAPDLSPATLVDHWSGLRPASFDGFPYIGRAAAIDNLFVAAGHFKTGLQMSTGTAAVTVQLISGQTPMVDLSAFRIERG